MYDEKNYFALDFVVCEHSRKINLAASILHDLCVYNTIAN